ncbi:MAG: hypothetical protein DLM61_17205 [Pseudonocardiales bacterium]|nr:MAG: hypothetical protein DLM61_17205 [Pseudonocardiales bacterium]
MTRSPVTGETPSPQYVQVSSPSAWAVAIVTAIVAIASVALSAMGAAVFVVFISFPLVTDHG